GHIQDNIDEIDTSTTYRQPTQLFHNERGRFSDVSAGSGPALARPLVGRGLAVGDFDNDGKVDALVVDSEGTPLLLHNDSPHPGHWLSLTLIGTRSNRDGYGALVTVTAGGLTQTRLCHADGSYLSSSDKRVHVGLGAAASAQAVTVRWPSGRVDAFQHVAADRFYTLREGGKLMPTPH
ncbi:MAG: CRTAC1 family protein, partial [Armatimonadetes bacterium]|nr:CRTAC1 family protein [Armatimonadota bacterium]